VPSGIASSHALRGGSPAWPAPSSRLSPGRVASRRFGAFWLPLACRFPGALLAPDAFWHPCRSLVAAAAQKPPMASSGPFSGYVPFCCIFGCGVFALFACRLRGFPRFAGADGRLFGPFFGPLSQAAPGFRRPRRCWIVARTCSITIQVTERSPFCLFSSRVLPWVGVRGGVAPRLVLRRLASGLLCGEDLRRLGDVVPHFFDLGRGEGDADASPLLEA
jgi:hypothetical protein